MGLGNTTKCDLCANTAKIDKQILIETLILQFRLLREKIIKETQPLETMNNDINVLAFEFTVHRTRTLESLVKALGKTAELLHTLKESDTRDNIEWV